MDFLHLLFVFLCIAPKATLIELGSLINQLKGTHALEHHIFKIRLAPILQNFCKTLKVSLEVLVIILVWVILGDHCRFLFFVNIIFYCSNWMCKSHSRDEWPINK